MNAVFNSLFQRLGLTHPAIENASEAHAELAPFLHAVDPKLSLLSNYHKVLEQPFSRLLSYVDRIAKPMEQPLGLSLHSFAMDPRLGMFFYSPSSLLATIQDSEALTEFFKQPRLGDEAYALLTMVRSEKSRLGMENDNGTLRTDVLQTVDSFDAHQLILAEPTPESFEMALRKRSIQLLAEIVASRLALQDQHRLQLEMEHQRLTLEIDALRRTGQRIEIAGAETDEEQDASLENLTTRLAEIASELAQLRELAQLDNRLAEVAHLIGAPEQLLGVNHLYLHLDRMGIVQEGENANVENLLCVEEVMFSESVPIRRVVVPVRVTLEAIRALEAAVEST